MTIQQVYPARSPGDRFDTATPKTLAYARQGLIWEDDELEKLRDLFMKNYDLDLITKVLQRPPGGVLPKLEQLKLIRRSVSVNYGAYRYVYNVHIPERPVKIARRIQCPSTMGSSVLPVEIQTTTETKETTMSTPEIITIETKTFIAGTDAALLTDNHIIKKISQLEGEAAGLRGIKASSTAIKAMIDKIDKDVAALVKYLDERFEASKADSKVD
jgi:hypothetical protein